MLTLVGSGKQTPAVSDESDLQADSSAAAMQKMSIDWQNV